MLSTVPGSETSAVKNNLFSQCFQLSGGGGRMNKNSSSSKSEGVVRSKKEIREGE